MISIPLQDFSDLEKDILLIHILFDFMKEGLTKEVEATLDIFSQYLRASSEIMLYWMMHRALIIVFGRLTLKGSKCLTLISVVLRFQCSGNVTGQMY